MSNDNTISSEYSHKHEVIVCKRCSNTFECKVGDIANCQCTVVSIRKETRDFLTKTSWGCLCANCLKDLDEEITSATGQRFPMPSDLKQGVHYYVENGLWVFTERYHILRGHCCKSRCRHCPYGYGK